MTEATVDIDTLVEGLIIRDIGRLTGRSQIVDDSIDIDGLDVSGDNTPIQNVAIALDYYGLDR